MDKVNQDEIIQRATILSEIGIAPGNHQQTVLDQQNALNSYKETIAGQPSGQSIIQGEHDALGETWNPPQEYMLERFQELIDTLKLDEFTTGYTPLDPDFSFPNPQFSENDFADQIDEKWNDINTNPLYRAFEDEGYANGGKMSPGLCGEHWGMMHQLEKDPAAFIEHVKDKIEWQGGNWAEFIENHPEAEQFIDKVMGDDWMDVERAQGWHPEDQDILTGDAEIGHQANWEDYFKPEKLQALTEMGLSNTFAAAHAGPPPAQNAVELNQDLGQVQKPTLD